PMFSELPRLLESSANIKTIIDVGTGYGVPACWFLERFPKAEVYGIEPNHERVRVASMAVKERGVIKCGRAPDIPATPRSADAAFMLDMTHFLTNEGFDLTLERLHSALSPVGSLIIRGVIPPDKHPSLLWILQTISLKITRTPCYYRSVEEIRRMIIDAGFKITLCVPSGSHQESAWFIAKAVS
ncbi:MAG: class I SAM-dependent methyltransferase, partial [Deltaproteobacteria bacterium]|nr:class I SAM-dependent methyltransferase [Deltaproteobacteria bacterium]